MLRTFSAITPALLTMFCIASPAPRGVTASNIEDPVRAETIWRGEVRQGTNIIPATLYFTERDDDRIKGELHIEIRGQINKFTLQGNIVDQRTVVWITDKNRAYAS